MADQSVPGSSPVIFSDADLDAFAGTSGDFNPLHQSQSYAVTTAFGGRVAHGILGCLAALGAIRPRPDRRIAQVTVVFHEAMVTGVPYRAEVERDDDDGCLVRLFDGHRWLLLLKAQFVEGSPAWEPAAEGSVGDPRAEAAELAPEDVTDGIAVEGDYACPASALDALALRFGLRERGVGSTALQALLCTSYLAGMRLPGRRALYSHLSLTLTGREAPGFRYGARITRWDPGVNLARIRTEFRRGGEQIAAADMRVFVRPDPADPLAAPGPVPEAWRAALVGRVALVIGASRGLGASLSLALASAGCTVVASHRRSPGGAERLKRVAAEGGGRVDVVQGDGGDPDWCNETLAAIRARHGRLDVLVCNASPALRPLWVDAESLPRVESHVVDGLRLIGAPLAACLPALAAVEGRVLVISSSAVADLPPEWPHYVAAKMAIEGFTRVAAREYPPVRFVIARPPRLATDFASSPTGHRLALHPGVAAATIMDALCGVKANEPDIVLVDEFPTPGPSVGGGNDTVARDGPSH